VYGLTGSLDSVCSVRTKMTFLRKCATKAELAAPLPWSSVTEIIVLCSMQTFVPGCMYTMNGDAVLSRNLAVGGWMR